MVNILKQYYKSLVGQTEWSFGHLKKHKDDLVICALHSVPKKYLGEFGRLIHWLQSHYTIIHPNALTDYAAHPERYSKGPYLLLTFDDGLVNNYTAAELLSTHNISALFFIVPDFVNASASEEYYLTHVRPNPDYTIDANIEDRTALSWDELKGLIQLGHIIGSHSKSHDLSLYMSQGEWEREIITSKFEIEQKLDIKVDHFASPNNTLLSTNRAICQAIQQNYAWHHTTIPGHQEKSNLSQGYVYRRNIEAHWPKSIVKFALGDFDLRRWQKRRDVLSRLFLSPDL